MSKITYSEYTNKDINDLVRLWCDVFGDKESFVRKFFISLPNMGSCVCAKDGDKIVAEACAITGFELVKAGSTLNRVCGYVYGVAVDENYRSMGIGKEISKRAYDMCYEREASIVWTLPAEDSLYDYYRAILPYSFSLGRRRLETTARKTEMTMKLTATEYMMFRESMLTGRSFLRPSYFTMDTYRMFLEEYGGGLFATESGIVAAMNDDGICVIPEIICANDQDAERSASAVAFEMGLSKCVYYLPGSEERFIISDKELPDDAVWSITFE